MSVDFDCVSLLANLDECRRGIRSVAGPFPFLRTWTEARWAEASGMRLLAVVAQLGAAEAFAYLYWQQVVGLGSWPQAAPLARVG